MLNPQVGELHKYCCCCCFHCCYYHHCCCYCENCWTLEIFVELGQSRQDLGYDSVWAGISKNVSYTFLWFMGGGVLTDPLDV